MMIKHVIGNIFESEAEAIVNTVNTVGVMGKGIALQFKKFFPNNYKVYAKACAANEFNIGDLLVVKDSSLLYGEKLIINFPTKTSWKKSSEYIYIEKGLQRLVEVISEYNIKSIAIPPLGAGNGGLNWDNVKALIEQYLSEVECDIHIYEPNNAIKEVMKKERVPLTIGRAMLLSVFFDLVKNGESVSEFAAEKIAYFLQRFGAFDALKLKFIPYLYGPYSGKLKYVLNYLNGSYITGFSAMDKKPFDELQLVMDCEQDVNEFLAKDEYSDYSKITQRTKEFLQGYYSAFSLELLSSVDFIMNNGNVDDVQGVILELSKWNERKSINFNEEYLVDNAFKHLNRYFSN